MCRCATATSSPTRLHQHRTRSTQPAQGRALLLLARPEPSARPTLNAGRARSNRRQVRSLRTRGDRLPGSPRCSLIRRPYTRRDACRQARQHRAGAGDSKISWRRIRSSRCSRPRHVHPAPSALRGAAASTRRGPAASAFRSPTAPASCSRPCATSSPPCSSCCSACRSTSAPSRGARASPPPCWLVTVATKMRTGWLAARGSAAVPGRLRAGTALVARGEFSIVIAGLAVAAGRDSELGPLAATYRPADRGQRPPAHALRRSPVAAVRAPPPALSGPAGPPGAAPSHWPPCPLSRLSRVPATYSRHLLVGRRRSPSLFAGLRCRAMLCG